MGCPSMLGWRTRVDQQQRIANLLGVHPPAVGPPVEPLGGILVEVFFREGNAQLVRRAQQNLAAQFLNRQTIARENVR
jgi:predicted transcriptional regulator